MSNERRKKLMNVKKKVSALDCRMERDVGRRNMAMHARRNEGLRFFCLNEDGTEK